MANFYAYEFSFDGIPSHTFNLKIINFDDGGVVQGVGSSDVEILTQKVLRKSVPYFLGRTQHQVLEFDLTFGTAYPISGMDRDLISRWLFGRSGYKKLEILQDDLNGWYFNCFLTKPIPIYVGGINYAFTTHVVCDSPWAYSYPKVQSLNIAGTLGQEVYHTVNVYNNSSEDEYLYPLVEFTMSSTPHVYIDPFMVIENKSDNDRAFRFDFDNTFLGETVTVDNDLQTIQTSSSALALDKFNKQWLRLLPKNNELLVGSIANCPISITFTERTKIGG